MERDHYIKRINSLMEKCCEERILYYIMTFLEKMVDSDRG